MTIDHDDTSYEPPHATSPTDHVLNELQLHGYRPFQDEPDPRPMPEARTIAGAVADIFDALVATLSDTRLEPDLEDLLWSVRHQRSLDRTGGLNKGEFLAHRNVHRSEDETANPTIEGTG
jgi:hypothetical protein